MIQPAIYVWTGEAMEPIPRHRKLCERQFVIGKTYCLDIHEPRSVRSHNHFFAVVGDVWNNLPDRHNRWQTADDLRKHALVHVGYANPPQHFACKSEREAQLLAGHLSRITDQYAEVSVDGTLVTRLTARSQSRKSMTSAEFNRSKAAVLEYLAAMIGVSVEDLGREAGHAA